MGHLKRHAGQAATPKKRKARQPLLLCPRCVAAVVQRQVLPKKTGTTFDWGWFTSPSIWSSRQDPTTGPRLFPRDLPPASWRRKLTGISNVVPLISPLPPFRFNDWVTKALPAHRGCLPLQGEVLRGKHGLDQMTKKRSSSSQISPSTSPIPRLA
jgi:hypothetical protein